MIHASRYGRLEIVEKLIQKGAKVNYKRDDGFCPLICACVNKHEKLIKVLLQKYNADTSIKCNGKTGY